MESVICLLVTLALCSVNATPTPQLFGNGQPWPQLFGNGQPWPQFGNLLQNFPRPPFFQNGFLNPFRPPASQVQVAASPQPIEPIQVQPPPVQHMTPFQSNAQWQQTAEIPDRQVSNNGWFWPNWIPVPIIPQYTQDAPTIVIISRPSKKPTSHNSNSNNNNTVSSESIATSNSSSVQSTNISVMVPNSTQPAPAPASTETPIATSSQMGESSSSTLASTPGEI